MRRIILLIALSLTAMSVMGRNTLDTDEHGHNLTGLWKSYYDALEADTPLRQQDILSEIKEKALAGRMDWDYYDACVKSVDAGVRRDWKQRKSLEETCRRELDAYGVPLLVFLYESDLHYQDVEDNLKLVTENREELQNGWHPVIYKEKTVFFEYEDVLLPMLKNDYEYALWRLLLTSAVIRDRCEQVGILLEECVKDSYPLAFFVDFYRVWTLPDEERLELMKDLTERYRGRAVSMLSDAVIIEHEFEKMEDSGAGSADYLKLRDRLLSCEKTRKSYVKGVDGLIAEEFKGFRHMLNTLEKTGAAVSIDNGVASTALRNLQSVTLKVMQDEKIICQTLLKNTEASFYKPDTLTLELPDLPDGDYLVECLDAGDSVLCTRRYPKYTISLACRKEAGGGLAVYATDYITGRPIPKVDLALTDYTDTLKLSVPLDGVTCLPADVIERIKANGYSSLFCVVSGENGRVRRSQSLYFGSLRKGTGSRGRTATVMTDRGAFNPGDTVRYKAIVFDRHRDASRTAVLPKGTPVHMTLCHGTKLISKTKHILNEFGSLAGEFVLGEELRNGSYRISVCSGDTVLGSAYVALDSFVLPTFGMEFEDSDDCYFPGDTVVVRGRLISYSGHPLSSASARLIVKPKWTDEVVLSERLDLKSDGTFEISFVSRTDKEEYYQIEVRVTDATGETQSFATSRSVSDTFRLKASLVNKEEGKYLAGEETGRNIFFGDVAVVKCEVLRDNEVIGLPLKYELYKEDKQVMSGDVLSGNELKLDFSSLRSGLYRFSLHTQIQTSKDGYSGELDDMYLLKIGSDNIADPQVDNIFCVRNEGDISIILGSGNRPSWHVVEMFDDAGKRVVSDVVYLEEGIKRLDYEFRPEYGNFVKVGLFRFFNATSQSFTIKCDSPSVETPQIGMTFTRFFDRTQPGKHYSYSLQGNPDAEILASVYDAATEKVRVNPWKQVDRHRSSLYYLGFNSSPGLNGVGGSLSLKPIMVRGYSKSSAPIEVMLDESEEVVVGFGTTKNEAIPFQLAGHADGHMDVGIRENFAKTLAFEPFIRPDRNGKFSLDFTTSDRLSTFVISLFSHDKAMNNSVLRKEFVVTLPVKVAVAQPQYLYEGDLYVLKTDVSNIHSEDVSGRMYVEVYDTENHREATPIMSVEKAVTVRAGANASAEFSIEVPKCSTLGLKVVFASDGYQDGQFVTVPVRQASQPLTEAYSAVLVDETDRDALTAHLRSRFVNTSADGAICEERKLMELFSAAMPEPYYSDSKDVVSQSEALCINLIASQLCDDGREGDYVEASVAAYGKLIRSFKNDGGIAWFEGGNSSKFLTALVLDRLAGMRDRGLLVKALNAAGENAANKLEAKIADAVAYLDRQTFRDSGREVRLSGITLGQYLYVRVKYPDVKFDEEGMTASVGKKSYEKVLTEIRNFLYKESTPGDILGKVQRIRILNHFAGNDARAARLMKREVASLKEYGVRHKSGAIYYPNAVMPFRGLIETEAYAHSMICDLFRDLGEDQMADGICLWLMLQKENQEWNTGAGFAEAAASVYDASDAVKNARIIVMKKTCDKPFGQVEKYGNGMDVSAKYFRETVDSVTGKMVRSEIREGESLNVGDRVYAEYKVWSSENRSFVRLSLPRHACLRPADQLSGYTWAPWSYREVRDDRTIYWVEMLPEEDVTFTEELFVMQEGKFQSPAPEVESLYAPYYRAADGSQMIFITEDIL